jgi:hypothetical protein
MLNELRELSISLDKAGISPPVFHPKFPLCPKKTAFWVYLDNDGNVVGVSSIPLDHVQQIRKWDGVGSLGTSFPAVSMPPLLKVAEEEHRKKLATMKRSSFVSPDEIQEIAGVSANLWADKFDKISKSLDMPVKDLLTRFTDVPEEYSAINTLLLRAVKVDSKRLYDQLQCAFTKLIADGDAKAIDALFFYGESNPTNQNDFQLVFEIKDWDHFPANHQNVQRWMNSKLLTSDSHSTSVGLDAFGRNSAGKDSKFPKIGFKNALGNVILRSMSHENPCQYRYGMINYDSFPAGKESREEITSALEWLGDEKYKGKTWCDLSRRMEKATLLFAYPSNIPQSQDLSELAGMMGDLEEDGAEINEERFALLAEKVSDALRGRISESRDSEIRVFVLAKRKGDARTKVIASSRYSAGHVIQSAQTWQDGCRILPVIEVRSFGKNKDNKVEVVLNNPLIPFPAEVVWCLNTIWMAGRDKNGKRCGRSKGVYGFDINDALCLLLGTDGELKQVATRAIGTLIRNSSSLLLSLGQASVQRCVFPTEKYAKQTLLIPSILGLLLYKLGLTKGEIMTSSAFLVGRLLNLADSLHLEYCKGVRKGSIPPQLVGNSLMATAQEEPVKALSVMWGRIKPYHAWAQTLKDGEVVGLVKFFLKQLGDVTAQLDVSMLPQRCTDKDKAQMLLGYLARAESQKN